MRRSETMLPPNDKLTICFAHVAYRLHERFSALNTGINSFAVRDSKTLENRVGEANVLVTRIWASAPVFVRNPVSPAARGRRRAACARSGRKTSC